MVLYVGLATIALLMVPLVAMQYTKEVDWSLSDFLIMGTLLFGTGSSYVLVTRYAINIIYKAALAVAIGTAFLMVWANLAVGLIGSGPHWGNLMYIGVLAVVVTGAFLSMFSPEGMARTMYTTALSLVSIAIIALLAGMDKYPDSSLVGIIGVNSFFGLLFALAGSLFHQAGKRTPQAR